MTVLPTMVYSNSEVLGFQVHRFKNVRLTHFASMINLGSENHPNAFLLYSMISAKRFKQYTAYIFTYVILPVSFTTPRFCFDSTWTISLFALVINSLLLRVRERYRKSWGGEGGGGRKKRKVFGVFLPRPSLSPVLYALSLQISCEYYVQYLGWLIIFE